MATQMKQNILDAEALVKWGIEELVLLGSTEARASAEWLLAAALEVDQRSKIYLQSDLLSEDKVQKYKEYIGLRKKRVPVAYIIGRAPFLESFVRVNEACLIPRPETEILVTRFIEESKFHEEDIFSFLDLGTGSGVIGLSLLRHFKFAHGTFVDFSAEALKIAEANVHEAGVSDRAEFLVSDLFKKLEGRKWNAILCNPPYLSEEDYKQLEPELLLEPKAALCAGEDGLSIYRRLIRKASYFLTFRGWVVFEVGFRQANAVQLLLEENGFINIRCFKDHADIDRVVMAQVRN